MTNADQISVFSDTLSSVTVDKDVKSVIVRSTDNGKSHITLML